MVHSQARLMPVGVCGSGVRNRRRTLERHALSSGLTILSLIGVTACSFHVSTGKDAVKENYHLRLNSALASVRTSVAGLHPVCDVGGSMPGCVTASSSVVSSLEGLKSKVAQGPVPSDYVVGQEDLMPAMADSIAAFTWRDQVIQTHDGANWLPANQKIQTATNELDSSLKERAA